LLYYSFLSVIKINVWHTIEQRTLTLLIQLLAAKPNKSIIIIIIDQWLSRVKTRTCAEDGHFKHMT